MALLSEQDRQTVRGHLAVIEEPVRLLFFTLTFAAPESVMVAKQVMQAGEAPRGGGSRFLVLRTRDAATGQYASRQAFG